MLVKELLASLESHPGAALQFVLPSGQAIPSHFHVTEVGRVEKDFIDCGGTRRNVTSCLLQVWTARDLDHRLGASRLAKILRLAAPLFATGDFSVEVEYGEQIASQYQLADILVSGEELRLFLQGKKTDCLAIDKCGVGAPNCC